ncbi:acyl-CoA dehydrogenase family protein [Mycolicibacterium pulveris]|uniref:Acyl-CoA dehydrogenase n=1 Tax=Mycolicibacterium pulveris TaxID=36813 RepID=A0A7I7UNX4_MYCPV|nr:acyl-CoA dehydrogenase family protein [Mycolicibacterium pulveris]MCV6983227.1 acyl-CoA dehydrogenase family protein [Mycolicibacterium pulveris]BBY83098.1 acyl-CoA dehydrogenase [Mycolicibacterium pulveris]
MTFTEDHEIFRTTVRGVIERYVLPYVDEWEERGIFPAHELFPQLADAGLLGLEYDVAYGGQGADHLYTLVLGEELGRIPSMGVFTAVAVQTDMATPSLHQHGSHALKERFLRPALEGRAVAAIAVTEPEAGSDVAGLRTRAVRDGDNWIINGSKLYITNGVQADWLCLLARTSDEGGSRGMSQIIVPTSTPGLQVSRSLRKVGNKASDTAELSFVDVRVPVANTIGEIGRGFSQQMRQFQHERMIGAYMAVGGMLEALARTRRFVCDRRAFGKSLGHNQYIQYRLAELSAELDLLRAYTHACAEAFVRGEDTQRQTAICKLKAARLQREIADWCLQFHGGQGYMEENWTARYFRDARLLSIGGGADEIMLRTLARLDGLPA